MKKINPFVLSGIFVLLAAGLSLMVGSTTISPRTMIDVIANAIKGTTSPLDPNGVYATILFDLRLPRLILLMLVGASLAGSGAAYQGLFRNPLADPYLIGVASGAGLGAVAAMTIQWPYSTLSFLAIPLAALLGGISAVLIAALLARVGKTVPTTNLILAGVVVSSFCTALSSMLMINASGELRRALVWLLGGSTMSGWAPVLAVLPYVVLGGITLLAVGHPLNVLQFGDEQAKQLGVPTSRVRVLTIIAATMMTAAAVAYAGIIGFVGLVIPHLVRMVWSGDYRKLIPLSFLGGAGLLLVTDVIARTAMAPQEIPVGIITSLIGAPFFLWILQRSKSQNYW